MKRNSYTYLMNMLIYLSIVCLIFLLPVAKADSGQPKTLLVWGDSLSAAYGIPVDKGWVKLLENKLGDQVKIVNASISGETTQGGLTRLPKALETHKPDLMILELGANDGLRGIRTQVMEKNLTSMIEMAQDQGAKVVLVGIKIPPNYGPQYTRLFDKVFTDLAVKYKLAFVPFMLSGVASDFDLMQADGIHPTAKAQNLILNNIWPAVETALKNSEKMITSKVSPEG